MSSVKVKWWLSAELGTWMNISVRTPGAVPSDGLAYRLLERRGIIAERLFELGVIYDKGFLELVEHLDHLAHSRVEKTHRPEQDLGCRLDACRLADFLKDRLDEPARRDRLGAGQVPRLPQGLLAFSQDGQPPADVWRVGVGVRLVGVACHLGALALYGPAEDLLARGRREHARPEEIRGSPDGDPHLASFVGLHQLLGHPGADRAFAGVGSVG